LLRSLTPTLAAGLGILCGAVSAGVPQASQAGDDAEDSSLATSAERQMAEALTRLRQADVPLFSVEVVEHWPQALLERHFRGIDLECRPAAGGPPTPMEMRAYSGSSIPVHADFLGPLKVVARLFRSKKARYFLYRIQQEDRVVFALNEGSVSEAARLGTRGVRWELIATYADQGGGLQALRRMESGFKTPERDREDERLPPWVETTCRPPTLTAPDR